MSGAEEAAASAAASSWALLPPPSPLLLLLLVLMLLVVADVVEVVGVRVVVWEGQGKKEAPNGSGRLGWPPLFFPPLARAFISGRHRDAHTNQRKGCNRDESNCPCLCCSWFLPSFYGFLAVKNVL